MKQLAGRETAENVNLRLLVLYNEATFASSSFRATRNPFMHALLTFLAELTTATVALDDLLK